MYICTYTNINLIIFLFSDEMYGQKFRYYVFNIEFIIYGIILCGIIGDTFLQFHAYGENLR